MTFRIRTMNQISPQGLALFDSRYTVGPETQEPDGILVRSAAVDTELFPSVVAVARAGAGVNNVTVERATARGVCVFNTPGANANAVAELVFIMLGLAARNIHQSLTFTQSLVAELDDRVISQRVEAGKASYTGFELAGKSLAVVGLGRIGVLVANYGIDHGMTVLSYDPAPTLGALHQLDRRVELAHRLDDVVRGADVITVHVPLSEKTRNLVGARQIEAAKRGVILLNYARQGIYDEDSVLAALGSGQARAYITDFPHRAVLGHPRVIATPHLGASTSESEENCASMAVRQLRSYLEYGVVTNAVNLPRLEAFPQDGARTRLAVIHRNIPNMIAQVTKVFGAAGLNIHSLANESAGATGYTLIDFDTTVSVSVLEAIRSVPEVIRVRAISLGER